YLAKRIGQAASCACTHLGIFSAGGFETGHQSKIMFAEIVLIREQLVLLECYIAIFELVYTGKQLPRIGCGSVGLRNINVKNWRISSARTVSVCYKIIGAEG